MEQTIVIVGLDLAKSVFQVQAIAAYGAVVIRRNLCRAEVIRFFTELPPCLVGMEACGSAHHWARDFMAIGHEVRLMPPAYVKPYVKRGKSDAADAEAICEAVTRLKMRSVAVKSVEQQAVLMLHKSRDLMVRQRTKLINALRGHLAEHGIVTGLGARGVVASLKALHDGQDRFPAHAHSALHGIAAQLRALASEIDRLEAQILDRHRKDETSRRLATIPGIGPITTSAVAAAVPDASLFRLCCQFGARFGLTLRANNSGGKERLGGITMQVDGNRSRLLVVGSTALMRMTRKNPARQPWMAGLLECKPAKIATEALANKTAPIAWAVMTRKEEYAAAAQRYL